jgi:hypothetical protein
LATNFVVGQPRVWLRVEGVVVLAVAATVYALSDASWIVFAVLFLAPDLSFLGYVAGPKLGSVLYNAVHSYAAPLSAVLVLLLLNEPVHVPLIWIAHIGFDRAVGYGLKYASSFQDTHLGRIGRPARLKLPIGHRAD